MRGLYQGIFGAAWGLSYFIGPLAGGWVYEQLGSTTLWIGCLVLGLILSLCYMALRVPARKRMLQGNSPAD